jgi:hypothetical protein
MLLAVCLALGIPRSVAAVTPDIPAGKGKGVSRELVLKKQMEDGKAAKEQAWAKARRGGVRTKGLRRSGSYFELVAFENNHPLYLETYNENAAISTGANLLISLPEYGLTGDGVIVGVWDAGNVRGSHQEFGPAPSRVVPQSYDPNNPHATHVAGTIAAQGVVAQAKGMAPQSLIWAYSMWAVPDYVYMEAVGATAPGQSNRIYLSNHSYGFVCGWYWDGSTPEWTGTYLMPQRDEKFGGYGHDTAAWDSVCRNDPYYLPFKAAGNDRNDPAPAPGQSFFRIEEFGGTPYKVWYVYDPCQHPPADGAWLGGYDTIPDVSTAKNIMTVGAVNDAVTGGIRDTSKATMTAFSAWGPTDDGRIKPDVVANGVDLYSPSWNVEPNNPPPSDSSYCMRSGTSMASPNACGSAALLIQLYGQLFPGQAMLSSTLKALMIHTADDLGNPGPDYSYGWGLVNARAAADLVVQHHIEPNACSIYEGMLSGPGDMQSQTFVWNGTGTVRVTLCWIDPPGASSTAFDDPTPRLVHDLDLRILDVNGVLGQPYVLDPTHPNWSATKGDNYRDNVEQADVISALLHDVFTVRVSMKTGSAGGRQSYSLIVTGQEIQPHPSLIRGKVHDSITSQGVPGVVISGQPGGLTCLTNSQGLYELLVPYDWMPFPQRGTVTPSKYGYSFVPSSVDYNDVRMDRYEQNYVATEITLAITGMIRDSAYNVVAGVKITSSPDVGIVYSDPNGGYSLLVPYGYSGRIAPQRDSMTFMPASRDYNNVTEPFGGQDYMANGLFHRISGRITDMNGGGLSGVGIIADPNHGPTYTDSGGYYFIDVNNHYSGVLEPSKYGFKLQPLSRTYSDVTSPQTGQDYSVNAVFYDGFSDNKRGAAWVVRYGPDSGPIVSEQNNRLNITAAEPSNTEVFYAGNIWTVDPNQSFTMKVNFHFTPSNVGEANNVHVMLGLDDGGGNYAKLLVGCAAAQKYYAFRAVIDGNSYSYQISRTANDGTMYITYDPNGDRLYAGNTGYGPDNDWQMMTDVFGKVGQYLRVSVGGGGNGGNLTAGQAWLDNVEINTGALKGYPPVTDLDGDGYIGWGDVRQITDHWLMHYAPADLNKDNFVNFTDLALVVAGW